MNASVTINVQLSQGHVTREPTRPGDTNAPPQSVEFHYTQTDSSVALLMN